METQDLLDIVCPQIRDLGWAFYFVPETAAAGSALGLDPYQFYFEGRGGVLGDVEGSVVASAFGYFEPNMVAGFWSSAKQIVAPRDAGRAFLGCAADFGRRTFSDLEDLQSLSDALDTVNGAADSIGLSLYAAAKAEPLATDLPARVMQLISVLREFRGSAHLVGLRAVGLDALTAHVLHRPADLAMFGWPETARVEITDDHRAKFAAAEAITDQIVAPAYAALDAAGQQGLVSGLASVHTLLHPPTY